MFSKYFSFEGLTNSEKHPELVPQNRIDAKKYISSGEKLSMLLEEIRDLLGGLPLKVNSGFRNAQLNKAAGSKSQNSKHTLFEAADITPNNMPIEQAFKLLMRAKESGKLVSLRKVLHESAWLHCEVSTTPNDYRGFFVSKDGNKTFKKVA